MNWSQKIWILMLGLLGTFLLGVTACGLGQQAIGGYLAFGSLLLLIILGITKKLIHSWHYHGSIGKGTRIWYD